MVMTDDDLVERFEYNRMRTIADGQHSKYLRAAAELYQLHNERTAMLDAIEAAEGYLKLDLRCRTLDDAGRLADALDRVRETIGDNRE